MKSLPWDRLTWECLTPLLLAAFTFAAYCQVGGHDFVNFDDNKYVLMNPNLRAGLSPEGVTWAFSSLYFSNWHPLTWLSYMLDYEIWGLLPGGYHLTNLLLHVAATLSLFAALRRLTAAVWRSAFVAALFALHPLHVESVAWVAERKDVLSGLFWMLTLWSYAVYAERPSVWRYLQVALCLAIGLLAKPMLVTLPFALLLLEYWPLGRLRGTDWRNSLDTTRIGPLLLEKLPLLLLAAGSCWITIVAQTRTGALIEVGELPLVLRIGNAMVAYVAYGTSTIWPSGLAAFYPHQASSLSLGLALSAGLLLGAISIAVLRFGVRKPYLPVGWLWYLGTLLPVIGLVQVGQQAMADRYTYLPLIGLFLIVSWGGGELWTHWRLDRRYLAPCALVVLSALFAVTWLQVGYWKNSITLWERALRVTSDNDRAHSNLATALLRRGNEEDAFAHYVEALRIQPRSYITQTRVAGLLGRQGKFEAARRHWAVAIWLFSEMERDWLFSEMERDWLFSEMDSRNDLLPAGGAQTLQIRRGTELALLGRVDQAIVEFEEALRLDPASLEARLGLGCAHLGANRREEAIRHYRQALRLHPNSAAGHYKLAIALLLDGRAEEAGDHISRAARANPRHRGLRHLLRKFREAAELGEEPPPTGDSLDMAPEL